MDRLTPEQRHKNMVAVKAKGTKPERLLAQAMWNAGLRYRKNDKTVFGCPDFVHKGTSSWMAKCGMEKIGRNNRKILNPIENFGFQR